MTSSQFNSDYTSQLIEDINIVPEQGITINSEQLKINNGTELLSLQIADKEEYLPASFIPKQEWKIVTAVEKERLILLLDRSEKWNLGKYIGVIQIPNNLIEPLRVIINTLNLNSDRPEHNISKISLHAEYQPLIQNISSYLQKYSLTPDGIQCLGIHSHCSGLITSTVDAVRFLPKQPRVGLHLDSWEKAPLKRRHLSKNRICINIGTETRYFLLINLSLMKMFEMLGLSTAIDVSRYYRGVELPDQFMTTFPDYPVVKIALEPNQAYIAPTENIIHDASSLEKQELDVTLTFLGKFGILPQQIDSMG
ncbi:hypothetical protein [Calothrix sp. PCC 7507]|uniref:hypothetical protein n=1 Tax=Calothrix sp. PCC 7507 TaxID=99598 RepID=UPI00029EDF45|nr:hypothetical protein [Calothrix sp. PCC 7507]AFY34504.1 hypothetical protein Cal7507_4123 [Calothrix sp. PCC 7507]